MLGTAIYNSRSHIVARRFSRQRQDLDLDFFKRRILQAANYRERHGLPQSSDALFGSESDGLPGVVIDRYREDFVPQTLTLAMDQRKELLVQSLVEIFAPRCIIERNDTPIRKAEGMELVTGVLHGADPGRFIYCGRSHLRDQSASWTKNRILFRTNSTIIGEWPHTQLTVACLIASPIRELSRCVVQRRCAEEVTAIDISASAVEQVRHNARANNLTINAVEANVFDFLHDARKSGRTLRPDHP
jgi:23S rRNA (cytosine1962-C5)-methyltransferase